VLVNLAGLGAETGRLLRFIGEQPALAGHSVARRLGFSLHSLVQSGVHKTRVSSGRPSDESSSALAVITWLSEDSGGGVLILDSLFLVLAGTRGTLCLILMLVLAALSRRSDATYLTLVLIAVSRCFGRCGEPDDHIPALTSMSVVIGSAARTRRWWVRLPD